MTSGAVFHSVQKGNSAPKNGNAKKWQQKNGNPAKKMATQKNGNPAKIRT